MADLDPWAEARAAAQPNAIVVKIVYPQRVEFFIEIPRTKANLEAGIDLYDGATVTSHSPTPLPLEATGTALPSGADHAGAPA